MSFAGLIRNKEAAPAKSPLYKHPIYGHSVILTSCCMNGTFPILILRVCILASIEFLLTTDIITNEDVNKIHGRLNLKNRDNTVRNAWLNVKNKAPKGARGKLLLHGTIEEKEEVVAILHGIPGCNVYDKSSVTERFDKTHDNRAHSSRRYFAKSVK